VSSQIVTSTPGAHPQKISDQQEESEKNAQAYFVAKKKKFYNTDTL
jgi:hypothetical protein